MSRVAIKLTAMKNQLLFAALCAAFLVPTRSDAEITIEAFYDPLDSYGDWIEVGDYGYCWQPHGTGADWRPYTVGEWVYTDAGWTWDSDEPYGWATYHYGQWVRLAGQGWVWVPDTKWAPAWVSWRHSDRYTGWAPLPPESRLTVGVSLGGGVGVSLGGWVDSYFDVGPSNYSFVETRYLGAPRLATVIVPPRENITIINETRNVTNIKVVNNVIVNNGPDYNLVAQQAERPIRKLRLAREEVTSVNALTKAKIEGDTIKMGTPRLAAQAGAKPRKLARKVERAEIDNGWQNAGSAPEVEKVREKLKAEAKVPDNLPSRDVARERVRTASRGDKSPKGEVGTPNTESAAPGAETAVSPTTDPAKAREEKPGKERKAGEKKQAETPPTADPSRRPKNQLEPLPQREPQVDKPESPETSPTGQPKERNRAAAKAQSDASQAEKQQEKAKRNRPETDQTPAADQPKERNLETAKPQNDAAQAERRQEKAKRDRAQADQAAAAAAATRQKEQAERTKSQEKPAVQRSKPNKPEASQPAPAAQQRKPHPEQGNPPDNAPQVKMRTEKPPKVAKEQRHSENQTAAAPQQPRQQQPKMNAAANPNRPAQVSPAPRQGQPQAAKKEGKKKGGKAESDES